LTRARVKNGCRWRLMPPDSRADAPSSNPMCGREWLVGLRQETAPDHRQLVARLGDPSPASRSIWLASFILNAPAHRHVDPVNALALPCGWTRTAATRSATAQGLIMNARPVATGDESLDGARAMRPSP
jgi:hypothetical protein